MNNSYGAGNQSPRYMEVAPNGQILHQSSTVPPDVVNNCLNSQVLSSSSSTYSSGQWSNYSYQTSRSKREYSCNSFQQHYLLFFCLDWWQNQGTFNPYRTTYQDYGQVKNQSNSNIIYAQPSTYSQV